MRREPSSIPPNSRNSPIARNILTFWARLDRSYQLTILAVLIGAITALGAIVFSYLIELVTGLCFHTIGQSLASQGLYIWLLPLLPMSGAFLVGLITRYFAPEAEGHGVPVVMDALARKSGRIRPRVASATAVASALTIGSGGAAGTEGPIIQIGSAIGSAVGQWLRISAADLGILVAGGASAGIAAIFNAPIAGVLFSVEVLLRDVSLRTFPPIIIAAVISSTIMQAVRGHNDPIFPVQGHIFGVKTEAVYDFTVPEIGNYILLGLLCGLAGATFIKLLYASEDLFQKLPIRRTVRPVCGALLVGLLAIACEAMIGRGLNEETVRQPAIMGNGYTVIANALAPEAYEGLHGWTVSVLLLLLAGKILGACFTLGSGGSGGVFAPSLFIGATAGGAFGLLVRQLPFFGDVSPGAYAMVGMATVVAATMHAPLTATLIIFELTRDYKVVLPIMLAAVTGMAVARRIEPASIYTLKLLRAGIDLYKGRDVSLLRPIRVREQMRTELATVSPDAGLMSVVSKFIESSGHSLFVVDADNHLQGVITEEAHRLVMSEPAAFESFIIARDLMTDFASLSVTPDDNLADVMKRMSRYRGEIPVVEEGRLVGVIRPEDVIERYNAELFKRDMASGMASTIRRSGRAEPLHAVENTSVVECPVPASFIGHSIGALNIGGRYQCMILMIKQPSRSGSEVVNAVPSADYVFKPDDVLLVMGPNDRLRELERGI